MRVDGEGKRRVLVVGEAPGQHEDEQGRPFVGVSGQMLKDSLRKLGVELRRDCWVTNALICRPPGNKIESNKWVEYCRPNVIKVIKELKPEKIILLGGTAVESVIGWLWRPPGGIFRWAGFKAPDRQINAWVCPTFHPSAILREKRPEVMRMVFDRHLEEAFALEGRPHADLTPPKPKLIYSPEEAVAALESMTDHSKAVAFDYETSHVSPYSEGSEILCASLSDGEKTFAFPWSSRAEKAMKRFLTSRTKKLSHNMKFEDTWSAVKLGVQVRNWHWDAMVTQHAFDNRQDICGLKFLAYAMLGYKSYDDHVEPYRNSSGPHGRNTLHKLPLAELLKYCALDSLYNHQLAEVQCKAVGVKL